MALSINTNIASLNAQRNLQKSQESLNTSLQRLSTGLRINSAKDDAAGLAISTRFTTQINGLNQAVRNANDGISLAQTGEAALDEITNNLQRIRELAVQSANSTYSASDRQALDAEVSQRLAEIDRIGSQTSFNGQKILDGSFGNAAFQVGANVGETVNVNLATGVKASQIGKIATNGGTLVSGVALVAGAMTIKVGVDTPQSVGGSVDGTKYIGTDVANALAGQDDTSAYAKAESINSASIPGLSATATTVGAENVFTDFGVEAGKDYSLAINGTTVFSLTGGAFTSAQALDAINQQSNLTGVTASAGPTSTASTQGIILTAVDGSNITLDETKASAYSAGGLANGLTVQGKVTLTASDTITVTGGTAIGATGGPYALGTGTLSSANVSSVASANDAIFRIDSALKSVSTLRSDFGAVQNRFESTITNLQTISENLSAARGRILDADFAAETANLTKSQILQQAGTAILAQANALPQAALSLLQ
jgi:flagellin